MYSSPLQHIEEEQIPSLHMHLIKVMSLYFFTYKPLEGWTEIRRLFADILSCKGENMSKTSRIQKNLHNGKPDVEKLGPDHPGATDCLEHVASSFNIQGVSIAMPQSSGDPECSKSVYRSDPAVPAKTKKLNMDRSDSKKYVLRNL